MLNSTAYMKKLKKKIQRKYNLIFVGLFLIGTFISLMSLIAIIQAVM